MSNLQTKSPTQELAVKLNESVLSVLGAENVQGFEKSYQIANSIQFLKENLTDEYMKPIMSMQGSRLGFKTDKDKDGGYPLKVVKECLIDAVLSGLEPYGNQFNIIAGNMYVTKEGYKHLLAKVKGLTYSIKHGIPKVDNSKQFAIVESVVKWNLNGEVREEKLEFSIKGNPYMTADSYTGKADRKARAFIFNQVSDIEVSDGDAEDVEYVIVETKPESNSAKPTSQDISKQRFKDYLSSKLNKDTVDALSDEELSSLEKFTQELDSYADGKSVQSFAKSKTFSELEKELIRQKFEEFKK